MYYVTVSNPLYSQAEILNVNDFVFRERNVANANSIEMNPTLACGNSFLSAYSIPMQNIKHV